MTFEMQSRKKRIGIITYWESNDNYGQQLQCWALQQYLRELGYSPFLIRFKRWQPKKKGIKKWKSLLKQCIAGFLYKTRLIRCSNLKQKCDNWTDKEIYRRRFPSFRKKNLKQSCHIYNDLEQLQRHPPQAHIYITGSDQVWNYDLKEGELAAYFLQFGEKNVKRVAYAPSIGHSEIPQFYQPVYRSYLQSFDSISVRESSAVDLIKKLGYDVVNVLDPTMLLDSKNYCRVLKGISAKPSVFIYSMNYASVDDIPFMQVKEYACQKRLPIVVTPGSGYLPAKELFDGVEYLYATIPQWIAQIENAELVVTASFHGVVMSIMFHRPFVFTPLRGKYASSNNRVLNLLDRLDLCDRIWGSGLEIESLAKPAINWIEVEKRLKVLRRTSTDYLIGAIE